jgi:hypothetical protein
MGMFTIRKQLCIFTKLIFEGGGQEIQNFKHGGVNVCTSHSLSQDLRGCKNAQSFLGWRCAQEESRVTHISMDNILLLEAIVHCHNQQREIEGHTGRMRAKLRIIRVDIFCKVCTKKKESLNFKTFPHNCRSRAPTTSERTRHV